MMPIVLQAVVCCALRTLGQESMADAPPATPPLPRRLAATLGLIAVLLVPWTLWLTFTLPTRHVTHNYRLAWVGFDVFARGRRSPRPRSPRSVPPNGCSPSPR